jgi:hypoxanthine phosphoribosyltransferase
MNFQAVIGYSGFTVGLVGLGLAAWQALRAEQLARRVRSVTWSDVQVAAYKLASQCERNKVRPSVIVAAGTRGGIIADLIRSHFATECPILVGVVCSSNSDAPGSLRGFVKWVGPRWTVFVPSQPNKMWSAGHVLIVDDFVRTGDAMKAIRNALITQGAPPEKLVTAAIAVSDIALDNNRAPDFYWRAVHDVNFSFPWGVAR